MGGGIMARMFRFLTADEIEVKIKQVKENGLVCLLYKTARTDMDLLDETVGAGNWTNDYKEIKGNLYAGIGIIQGNGGIQWKWDCGIESREDEEGTLTADPLEEENLTGEGMEKSAGQPSQAEPEETAGEAAPQAPESAQAGPQEAPAPEKAPEEEPRQAGEDEPRA